MEVKPLEIPYIKLLNPKINRDQRGLFSETYNAKLFRKAGIQAEFVQDNHSLSLEPGIIRGLHFQRPPHAQGKLVRVIRGAIFDVAVDIREGSPTYGKYVSSTLTADNWQQIWIPEGFAHDFCTLEPNTEIIYKMTDFYFPSHECGIRWNDSEIGIQWPLDGKPPVLSEKDRVLPVLLETENYFSFSQP